MAAKGVVETRPSRAPQLGLLTSAREVVNGSDSEPDSRVRWVDGFKWDLRDCGSATVISPCGATTHDGSADNPTDREFDPFIVETTVECSTFGSPGRDDDNRVREKLLAVRGVAIEDEFWNGTRAQAEAWANAYLNDSGAHTLIDGVAEGYVTALARLEEAVQGMEHSEAMIHCAPHVATLWASEGLITREGNLLRTILGTIVVAGRGYDGSGPDGTPAQSVGASYAYLTDLVSIRLGAIRTIVDDTETIDRSANDVRVVAQQFAAVTFNGCLHHAINVDHANRL